MSESQQGYGTRPQADRGGLLTPESTAITAFTLAVLSLTGQGVWTQLAQVFFGGSFGADQYVSVISVASFGSAVVEVAALLLARRALASVGAAAPWSGHLARAAAVLAAVALVFSALTFVIGLLTHL